MSVANFNKEIGEYLANKFKDAKILTIQEATEFITCRAWRLCIEEYERVLEEYKIKNSENRKALFKIALEERMRDNK